VDGSKPAIFAVTARDQPEPPANQLTVNNVTVGVLAVKSEK
jgi:hypothetical protein